MPAEPVLSKSLRTVRMVVVAYVVEAFVTFSVLIVAVPETVMDGVEITPADEMVVVAEPPMARVVALRSIA